MTLMRIILKTFSSWRQLDHSCRSIDIRSQRMDTPEIIRWNPQRIISPQKDICIQGIMHGFVRNATEAMSYILAARTAEKDLAISPVGQGSEQGVFDGF